MKKLLNILLALAMGLPVMAQEFSNESLRESLKIDSRIDELFEMKSQLLNAKGNTRTVDMELASYGIRFPARVKLTQINSKTNISFALLEDSGSEGTFEKIEKIKQATPEIEYIGIDPANHNCYVTFSKVVGRAEIQNLLREFHYEDFYVMDAARQFGAFVGN